MSDNPAGPSDRLLQKHYTVDETKEQEIDCTFRCPSRKAEAHRRAGWIGSACHKHLKIRIKAATWSA
jgi:hypothetical protein